MSQYFIGKNGEFVFPDGIFPEPRGQVGNIPENPHSAAVRLGSIAHDVENLDLRSQSRVAFKWANEVLTHSELYGSMPQPIVQGAIHILNRLAEESPEYAPHATYLQANWYLFGLFGHEVDPLRARELYKRSIQLGHPRAWYRMAANAEARGDMTHAISRYENGAKLGDAACIYRLAMASLRGHFGAPIDPERGIKMLIDASDKIDSDFPQPAFLLGKIKLREIDISAPEWVLDRKTGIEYIEKASKLHFAPAIARMSQMYQGGDRGTDCAVALRYLHCAARQERFLVYESKRPNFNGDAESQLVKWFLCGYGNILPRNEEWAYKFACSASEVGNSTAQFALGYFSEVGIYVPEDLDKAVKLYRMSAKNECDAAQQRLKKMGLSLEENEARFDIARTRTFSRQDHEANIVRATSQLEGRTPSTRSAAQIAVDALSKEEPEEPAAPQNTEPAQPRQDNRERDGPTAYMPDEPRKEANKPYNLRQNEQQTAGPEHGSTPYPEDSPTSQTSVPYPDSSRSGENTEFEFPRRSPSPKKVPYPDSPSGVPSSQYSPKRNHQQKNSSMSNIVPVTAMPHVRETADHAVNPYESMPTPGHSHAGSSLHARSTASFSTDSAQTPAVAKQAPRLYNESSDSSSSSVNSAVSEPAPRWVPAKRGPPPQTHRNLVSSSNVAKDMSDLTLSGSTNSSASSLQKGPVLQPQATVSAPVSTHQSFNNPGRRSPARRHRVAQSMTVPVNNRPEKDQRTFSQPLKTQSNATRPLSAQPVPRPQANQTFESMGFKTYTEEKSGPCVIM